MADQGTLTRIGNRRVAVASPKIPASGPTPSTPSASVGQYADASAATLDNEKGTVVPLNSYQLPYTARWSYFKMRGQDAHTNGVYDTWLVIGAADTTGAQYTGALATPLRDVVIAGFWTM